jgi:hypothetical protein
MFGVYAYRQGTVVPLSLEEAHMRVCADLTAEMQPQLRFGHVSITNPLPKRAFLPI